MTQVHKYTRYYQKNIGVFRNPIMSHLMLDPMVCCPLVRWQTLSLRAVADVEMKLILDYESAV